MTSKMAVDKELVRLKEKNSALQKFKEAKGTQTRKSYRIAYEKRGGICYRVRQRKDVVGDTQKADFGAQVVESESNGSGSRFFVWWTFGSEENGEQDPD